MRTLAAAALLALAGCASSVDPPTIARDRFDYVEAISESWKTQMLLGMCEKRMGQMGRARADLESAFPRLQEEKLRVEAGMELIELYYTSGDLDKAASVVTVLKQLRPDDPEILYTAHRIHSEQADGEMLGMAMLAPKSARMHQLMAA